MVFNPNWNLERPQVVEAIAEIQERLLAGAKKVAHSGSGGIDNFDVADDERNLMLLARRLAEIDGTPLPTRATVKSYVIRAVGYRYAKTPR